MKVSILTFLSFIFFAISLSSCEKDPCEDTVCLNGGQCDDGACDCPLGYSGENCENYDPCYSLNCQNGGYCEDGHCNCPPGYTGTECETYDPCYGVDCQNGGYCQNGECECPTGFYGEYCQYQHVPRYMKITRIDVVEFPAADHNGYYWDSFSLYPDIFLLIRKNDQNMGTTGYYQDCTQENEYHYSGYSFTFSINDKCSIRLYDYEGGSDSEYMCGYYFYPSNNYSGLPDKLTIYNSNSWHRARLEVYVKWIF